MNILIMASVFAFLLGLLLGALVVYALTSKKSSAQGMAGYMEQRTSRKQQRKETVLELAKEKGEITNNDVESLLNISDSTATEYLQELEDEGLIEQIGKQGRGVSYRLKSK